MSFAQDRDHATEITPIQSANDDYYITLENRISSRILTGHRITSPLLLGIKDIGTSGLGNNANEILVAAQHFTATVVVPIQKIMLKVFDRLLGYYGYDEELYIEPLSLFNEEGKEVGPASVEAKE